MLYLYLFPPLSLFLGCVDAKAQIQLPQNQKLPRSKLERDKNVISEHTPALYCNLVNQN